MESGDRMELAEFRWRYALRPDVRRAELIDGVVYAASPVNFQKHGGPHLRLIVALSAYIDSTAGVIGADNGSIRLDSSGPETSEPQPDLTLCWDAAHGGRATFDDDGWLTSAPDFVAEIAHSSRAYDLTVKKRPLSPDRGDRVPGLAG